MDYAISGRFALDVTDSWVFKQFIATTGHTAKKKEGERTKRSTSKLLRSELIRFINRKAKVIFKSK